MKMHANARLSLKGRELLVDRVKNAGVAGPSPGRGARRSGGSLLGTHDDCQSHR